MTEADATNMVDRLERLIVECQHPLATPANKHVLARAKRDLITTLAYDEMNVAQPSLT